MKNLICILILAALLSCWACAEETAAPTPAPTALPAGETFASEDLIVTLPYGLTLLEGNELAGYEAAVENDFPDSGRMLMAAVNADRTAAAGCFAIESEQSAAAAAEEAARIILGDQASLSEFQYGENIYVSFSCGIGEDVYKLYYLQGEGEILLVALSGIEEASIETMLADLVF